MKYMGSKARIVHEILPIMLDKEHDTFVDAFCGGCSVIENVPNTYRRIAISYQIPTCQSRVRPCVGAGL